MGKSGRVTVPTSLGSSPARIKRSESRRRGGTVDFGLTLCRSIFSEVTTSKCLAKVPTEGSGLRLRFRLTGRAFASSSCAFWRSASSLKRPCKYLQAYFELGSCPPLLVIWLGKSDSKFVAFPERARQHRHACRQNFSSVNIRRDCVPLHFLSFCSVVSSVKNANTRGKPVRRRSETVNAAVR